MYKRIFLNFTGIVHDTMAVASYLKFHPNLSKHGGGGANSEMQSGLASAASAKQEESQRQRQRLVESILITPRII